MFVSMSLDSRFCIVAFYEQVLSSKIISRFRIYNLEKCYFQVQLPNLGCHLFICHSHFLPPIHGRLSRMTLEQFGFRSPIKGLFMCPPKLLINSFQTVGRGHGYTYLDPKSFLNPFQVDRFDHYFKT